jgi:DNA-binding CsgD family transcriptional regulator
MGKLTPRERQVVALLAQGRRQTEIARILVCSPRTVEAHTRSARYKTGASSAIELAIKVAIEEHDRAK